MKIIRALFQMTTPQLIDLYYRERLDDQQLLMHQYHTIGEVPPYGNTENITYLQGVLE